MFRASSKADRIYNKQTRFLKSLMRNYLYNKEMLRMGERKPILE